MSNRWILSWHDPDEAEKLRTRVTELEGERDSLRIVAETTTNQLKGHPTALEKEAADPREKYAEEHQTVSRVWESLGNVGQCKVGSSYTRQRRNDQPEMPKIKWQKLLNPTSHDA